MRLPQRLANANRAITNPSMRRLASRVAPLGIVHHRGRRPGNEYSSPVLAFGISGGHLIPPVWASLIRMLNLDGVLTVQRVPNPT